MPADPSVFYDGYYNTSPECWSLFTEVIGAEFENAVLFGQVHQLTVDAYAVQHAGGDHPDKSVAVHLSGLHLVFERGLRAWQVARPLQKLADRTSDWPNFAPAPMTECDNILDIALAADGMAHAAAVRRWAGQVWTQWSTYAADIAELCADLHLEVVHD